MKFGKQGATLPFFHDPSFSKFIKLLNLLYCQLPISGHTEFRSFMVKHNGSRIICT